MNIARTGKIARLPQHVRTQLNRRLADGEPGRTLLPWLNAHGMVRKVLKEFFNGHPITDQNLSEWRQGGYEDWLRHQEARDFAREFLAEAEELEEEVGDIALTDRTCEIAALALLRLLREAQMEKGPAGRKAVLEIVRELQRLRRGDHQMSRQRIQEERWEAEQIAAEEAELKEMRQKTEWNRRYVTLTAQEWWEEYRDGLADGTLDPEHAARLREYWAENAATLRDCGVPELPTEENPSNSDQFAPIRTIERRARRTRKKAKSVPEATTPTDHNPTESPQSDAPPVGEREPEATDGAPSEGGQNPDF